MSHAILQSRGYHWEKGKQERTAQQDRQTSLGQEEKKELKITEEWGEVQKSADFIQNYHSVVRMTFEVNWVQLPWWPTRVLIQVDNKIWVRTWATMLHLMNSKAKEELRTELFANTLYVVQVVECRPERRSTPQDDMYNPISIVQNYDVRPPALQAPDVLSCTVPPTCIIFGRDIPSSTTALWGRAARPYAGRQKETGTACSFVVKKKSLPVGILGNGFHHVVGLFLFCNIVN